MNDGKERIIALREKWREVLQNPSVLRAVRELGRDTDFMYDPLDCVRVLPAIAERLIVECDHAVHLDEDVLLFDGDAEPQFVPHDLLSGEYSRLSVPMRAHTKLGHLFVAGGHHTPTNEWFVFWTTVPVFVSMAQA